MIDILIFSLVAVAVLSAYAASTKAVDLAKSKIAAVALANAKMEEYRNMPYDSLATQNGPIYPPGNILDDEQATRGGIEFKVHTVISYVDDIYDGDAGGSIAGKPVDLFPYDYKKVEVTVSKVGRKGYLAKMSSNFSAKAAETPSNSGIIKICVVDSTGAPVPEADVTVTNPDVTPPVNISAVTAQDGCIMIPNLPPTQGSIFYHLTATKDGYSIDMTYPRTPSNPTQIQPDVSVLVQQVTNQTLVIDKTSSMNIELVDDAGQKVAGAAVHVEGAKLTQKNPVIHKYSQDLTSDAEGKISLSNMEFDNYTIVVAGWSVVSTSPYQPVDLKADTTLSVKLTLTQNSAFPAILTVDPVSGKVGETAHVSITGRNFSDGLNVKLINAGGEIVGNVTNVTSQAIEVEFNLNAAIAGIYDLLVSNPDASSVRQISGFEVKI